MAKWPARDLDRRRARIRVVAHSEGVGVCEWLQATSRADNGRDPVGDGGPGAAPDAETAVEEGGSA
jgi:hypothetical protein